MSTWKIPEQRTPPDVALLPLPVDGVDAGRQSRVAGSPWLPRGYVPRRALWNRLDLSTRHAVTVVVAPAGAGKSLGVAGWLEADPARAGSVWLAAEKDLVPAVLDEAVAAAGVGPDGLPHLVVVDDAHQLPAATVRHVNDRLSTDPEGFRVVLLARWDLALSRLVPELLGHLTVLRGDVLRLSREETARLVAEHARTGSPEVCDAIVRRADGWCAAVVLAARAGAAAPDPEEFARRLDSAGAGVADLVAGELFAALRSGERHLLLCTAGEPVLTAEAARHLTRDEQAGQILATLESTGLLVSRVAARHEARQDDIEARFRIHPLLLEVVRRRLVAGGVDVQLARSTVLRAARIDLARGDVADGFRRLLALGEHDAAAEVLEEHGPRLLDDTGTAAVHDFVRRAGAVVDRHPRTWPVVAWAHWLDGSDEAAAHWSQRVQRHESAHPGSVSAVQSVTVGLQRARRGLEPVGPAVEAARSVVEPADRTPLHDPLVPLLMLELGAAENWLGELDAAERHLSHSVMLARTERLQAVTDEALTHLALTELMVGREAACHDLALGVLTGVAGARLLPATRARAEVALGLARLHSLPWTGRPEARGGAASPDDLAGRVWHRVLESELCLTQGRLADAQRRLEAPSDTPALPAHLQTALWMEESALALVTGHRAALRHLAVRLHGLEAPAEALWADAALAELDGDLHVAAQGYLAASRAEGQPQPATQALGLVCAAQLHDYLGDSALAQELLVEVVTATESRRCAVPFLGWSPHGTRVGTLLARMPSATTSPWGEELRRSSADRPGVVTMFRPLVGTQRELDSAVAPTTLPPLSPREHEVLGELARGATYSDIAASLFVSENTVKTHVSSLYMKLAVGRRSEALAVARKLHLL